MIVSEPQLHYVDGLGLQGNCGYRIEEDRVLVNVESITSDRDIENLSGSLSLELWANRQPFNGGELDGVVLAGTDLGELQGQHLFPSCEYDLIFTQPPIGSWHLSLVLREWTENGYQVRDFMNFELPYQVNWTPVLVDAAAKVVKADFGKQAETDLPEDAEAKSERALDSKTANTEPKKADEQAKQVEVKKPETNKTAAKKPEAKKATVKEADAAKSSKTASVATAAVETAKKKVSGKPVASSVKVNVNSASVAELTKVTGVSKKLAEAIVADRPYKSVQALIKVKGMGARTLSKLETSFTVA